MADYGSWPLWHAGPDSIGNIDPASLSLSPDLIEALTVWSRKLDSALDWNDPGNTIWPESFFAGFNAEGRELAQRLRNELGDSYQIVENYWGED